MPLSKIAGPAIQTGAFGAERFAKNSIGLHHCDWYSDSDLVDAGGLKIPAGSTSERPTVNTGGREVVSFDLNVTNNNSVSGDGDFQQNEPWLWSWSANYNRTAAATRVTDTSSLTLLKGSTYTFRNFTAGHGLFLRHTEKTDSADSSGVFLLTAADGIVSGTQGTLRVSDGVPGEIVLTIPDDYAYSNVVVQHAQPLMANTLPVATPSRDTLGYLRLNTSNLTGADATTGTVVEYYTGQGWATVGASAGGENGSIIAHPTGTLTEEDWYTASGSEDWNTASGTDDFGSAIVNAFGDNGDISLDSNYAVVAHDGSTGGGIPMLRADMSNLSASLVNSKYNFFRSNAETVSQVAVSGSISSRLSFDNAIEAGVSNITASDNNKIFTINKDVTNAYFKFDIKIKPSDDCTLQIWKNGSHLTYADYELDASYHATATWIESASFGDTFEFRLYKSDGATLTVTNKDTLLIEFIGS